MNYNPDIHHRRSIRLRDYDYGSSGGYFVTICTHQRECLFGDVVDGEMRLNGIGEMVETWWEQVKKHFSGIVLDEYVIMPNHFHGIVTLVGAGFPRPDLCDQVDQGNHQDPDGVTPENPGGVTPPLRQATLGQVIGYFKYQSTKCINQFRNSPGLPLWQRSYYEHIIRNDNDLKNIRQYIINNPFNWETDDNNPLNVK